MPPRRLPAREKEIAENAVLLRSWRQWHREQREMALAGPHRIVLGELLRMLESLKNVQPAQLIGFLRAINWSAIEYDTRLIVLHELNTAITAFREKRGFAPIDDGLPGEPDTPFRMIRAIVLAASPLDEGAHRGGARLE